MLFSLKDMGTFLGVLLVYILVHPERFLTLPNPSLDLEVCPGIITVFNKLYYEFVLSKVCLLVVTIYSSYAPRYHNVCVMSDIIFVGFKVCPSTLCNPCILKVF